MKAKRCPKTFLTTAISFALAACMLVPRTAHALSFSDVSETTPHADHITWLAQQNISTGYSDNTFRPMTPVYRQDMAAFLYRLAGEPSFTPSASDRAKFKDVDASTPHAEAIWWLASAGISSGYPDGTFRPMAEVVRQDMAAFLRRLATAMGDLDAALWVPQSTSIFPDVNENTYHWEDILWLAETGISTGYPDGSFKPGATVARQDMAAFLHRLYDHVQSHNPSQPTDTYEFGEDQNYKYIYITDGSSYELFDCVWTTPEGLPINYFGEGLYVYDYTGSETTITIPSKLDGFDVMVAKFGLGALPTTVNRIDATKASALRVFFDDSDGVTGINLDGLTNLERVNVGGKNLSTISFPNCPNLFEVLVCYTKVSSIDVSTLPNLENLGVDNNKLTSLDISHNPKLIHLQCERNLIEDTSKLEEWLAQANHSGAVLPQLKDVTEPVESTWNGCRIILAPSSCGCEVGQVIGRTDGGEEIRYDSPGVYIASIPNDMKTLSVPEYIDGLPVIAVNLSEPTDGDKTNLTNIDARDAKQLQYLQVTENMLSSVLISGLSSLEVLEIRNCPITNINLSGCSKLYRMLIECTLISSIDLSSCPNLTTLVCSQTKLTEIDITPCANLSYLSCYGNYISDTSQLEQWLQLPNHSGKVTPQFEIDERVRLESSNGYTYIVVESGSGVTWGDSVGQTGIGTPIYYRGNGAYIIESTTTETLSVPSTIQGHTVRSITLGKAYGMISALDARNASSLACIELMCPNLDTLLVQGLGQLLTLNVQQTRLREMDLTGCENLSVLVGTQNRLTSLDLSSTSKLSALFVSNNQLTSLDISPCSRLSQLDCKHNRIADTSNLEAWLEQEGHSGSCLPQDV